MIKETIIKHQVTVLGNSCIKDGIFELSFRSEQIAKAAVAGQFVNVYLPGGDMLLPRPFGISNVEDEIVTVVYAVVGAGTKRLSELEAGKNIDVLGPNGNGFDISKLNKNVIIVGGGLGVPPLLLLAKQIENSKVISVLGYRDEAFYFNNIKEYCDEAYAISEGVLELNSLHKGTGNVIDVLKQIEKLGELNLQETTILACGPKPMLIALAEWTKKNNAHSQFSLEERMGCGYGACVGCVCTIIDENGTQVRKKVCKDGPVFDGNSIVW